MPRARKRLIELMSEFAIGLIVMFISLLLSTGMVVIAAVVHNPATGGYAILACLSIAVVLTQHSVFGEVDESAQVDLSEASWTAKTVAGLLMLLYFNTLVFVATVFGIVGGSALGGLVVTSYVLLDMVGAEYGWPLSVTMVAGVILFAVFRLEELFEDIPWGSISPADLLDNLYGKRSNPR